MKFNPQTITQKLTETFGSMCDEIKLNKNGLIPCPGTMQGGCSGQDAILSVMFLGYRV